MTRSLLLWNFVVLSLVLANAVHSTYALATGDDLLFWFCILALTSISWAGGWVTRKHWKR